MPTYAVTAPNGKTLEITGDHVPSEAELHDIFAKAGVDTGSDAPREKLGAVNRFLEGAIKTNPVSTGVDFLSQMMTDPKGAGQAVIDPSVAYAGRALEASRQGRPAAALGEAASAVPLIGPYVRGGIDRMRTGDVAGGLGELSWLASPGVKKAVGMGTDAAIAGAKTVAPDALNRVADLADVSANERLAKVIAPQTGPNKTRLGNKAVQAAPELLRDKELSGYSRTGLAGKIADRLDQATDGLDVAADSRLASQQVRTRPILAALDKQIAGLTAQPVDASHPVPSIGEWQVGPDGFTHDVQARPLGKSVVPAPNSAEIATLRTIRDEVGALGPVAPYESVRRIRASWDKVAKVKYLPATAQDALKSQGDATAAAKGTSAMREALAETSPADAAAYQQYSLYKSANDVVQAAEEADRVRPNRGRGIMARTAGAMIGAKEGGAVGAAVGAVVAGIVDKAAEMAPTFQIAIARKLAAVADKLRTGDTAGAQVMTDAIVQSFPAVKTGLRVVGKTSAMAGRAMQTLPLAAGEPDATTAQSRP